MITEALNTIGVVADGKQPTATQSTTAITVVNDQMMTQIKDGWWDIGWYPMNITNLPNTAPLRDEDLAPLKLVWAAWLAPRYGITIATSPDPTDMTVLGNQIKEAFRQLNKRYLRITECDLGELSRPQGGPWGGPNYL